MKNMQRNIISERQFRYLCILVGIGGLLVIGGVEEAGHESYLSAVLALAIVIPMILIFSFCIRLQGSNGVFEWAKQSLGPVFGKIVIIIFTVYAFVTGSFLLSNFTSFTNTTLLSDVPPIFVGTCLMLCIAFMVGSGVGVIGKVGSTVGRITAVILVVTQLIALSNAKSSSSLLPFMPNGIEPIAAGALGVFASALGDIVLVLPIAAKVKKSGRAGRQLAIGSLIACGILIVIFLRNLIILGKQCSEILYFKSFYAVSIMTFGRFFERLEILVSAAYILSDFIKLGVCAYFISEAIKSLFSIKDGVPLMPIAFIITVLSSWFFGNEQELLDFKLAYKFFAPIAQILLPALLLAVAKIKSRRIGLDPSADKLESGDNIQTVLPASGRLGD